MFYKMSPSQGDKRRCVACQLSPDDQNYDCKHELEKTTSFISRAALIVSPANIKKKKNEYSFLCVTSCGLSGKPSTSGAGGSGVTPRFLRPSQTQDRGSGCDRVSVLRLDERDSLICDWYLGVSAQKIILAYLFHGILFACC